MKFTKTKAIVAAVGFVATLVAGQLADGVFDASEAGQLVTEVIGAAMTVWAVYQAPNKPVPPQ